MCNLRCVRGTSICEIIFHIHLFMNALWCMEKIRLYSIQWLLSFILSWMWKEMVLAWSEVQSGIWLAGLRKTTKNAGQVGRCRAWNPNSAPICKQLRKLLLLPSGRVPWMLSLKDFQEQASKLLTRSFVCLGTCIILILVINQLNAQNLFFIINVLDSTCFEYYVIETCRGV